MTAQRVAARTVALRRLHLAVQGQPPAEAKEAVTPGGNTAAEGKEAVTPGGRTAAEGKEVAARLLSSAGAEGRAELNELRQAVPWLPMPLDTARPQRLELRERERERVRERESE